MTEPQTTAQMLTPVEYLAQFSPEASEAFQGLRKAVMAAGPLAHIGRMRARPNRQPFKLG